jgi:methionyl-tRNA formyltransferase
MNLSLESIEKAPRLSLRNHLGWTPLMVASYQGNFELVKELVKIGQSVNDVNFKGTSVLMFAKSYSSKSNNLEVVKYLIDNGADIFQRDDYGINAIQYAEIEGNKSVITFLKEAI